MKKRNYLIGIAVAALLAVYLFVFFQKGIVLGDSFLLRRPAEASSGNAVSYSGKINGFPVSVFVEKYDENNCRITFSQEETTRQYRLEGKDASNGFLRDIMIYEGDQLLFDGKYDDKASLDFFRAYKKNGEPYLENMITITVNGREEPVTELSIPWLLKLFCGDENFRGNVPMMLVAGLILLIWIIDLCFPRFFFTMRHWITVKDPEPSDFYLIVQRAFWVIYPVIAVFLLMFSLISA